MVTFRPGDVFALPLPTGEYLTGRVMLDVARQCVRPGRLEPGSPLAFYGGAVLVEIDRTTFPEPTPERSPPLIPGAWVNPAELRSGTWRIIGHEDVDPVSVEFPESLIRAGLGAAFRRGEIHLPLDLTRDEFKKINVHGAILPTCLGEFCLYHLGRADEIGNPYLVDVELRSLARTDLRFNPDRGEVYRRLGEDPNQSYHVMARRLDHPLERFYPVILCPSCLSAIGERTRRCPACRRDVTRDARIEIVPSECSLMPRTHCTACGGTLLELATVCATCGRDVGDGSHP